MGKEFRQVPLEYNFKCSKCGSTHVEYRTVEDSECHEDYEYHCIACNRYWWVDGSDY